MSQHKPEKKFLFVINHFAGGKHKNSPLQTIRKFLEDNHFEFHFYETCGDRKTDKEEIRKRSEEIHPDAVIAVGGDGTINLVGETLIGHNIPLGIIPAGSSNGLARDLNIPKNTTAALHVIKKFKSKHVDTLLVNGKHSFHISDLGFNARVCHRFADSIRRGKGTYIWHAIKEFISFKIFTYHIETPLLKYDGKAFMITVSNSNKFGTNASINPLGENNDGYFEVNVIKPFPKIILPYILFKLFNHTIHLSSYNKIIHCKKAAIYNKDNESFHIDGEPESPSETIYVDIFPNGLKVLLP